MAREIPESHPLVRLFRGLTEHTFQAELGIADPEVVGYVADLLTRFVPSRNLAGVRDAEGRSLVEIAAILAEAERTSDADRRRECHRHIGDLTLFWTGVFPEALGRIRASGSAADQLIDYPRQGKRSYHVASTIDGPEAPVLRRLSAEFEMCAYGLSRIRKEWESLPASDSGPPRFVVA
jgi:hypothetical protein